MIALNVQIDGGRHRDVVVLGAGLIGLSLALELNDRGARVAVLDRWRSLTGASIAAAGMLAAEDPCNPRELLPLSRLSIERYPGFLRRIETLSGMQVPFQTESTMQSLADGTMVRLTERSIDPRQLATALRAAVAFTSIELIEEMQVASVDEGLRETRIGLESGVTITARSRSVRRGSMDSRGNAHVWRGARAYYSAQGPDAARSLAIRACAPRSPP